MFQPTNQPISLSPMHDEHRAVVILEYFDGELYWRLPTSPKRLSLGKYHHKQTQPRYHKLSFTVGLSEIQRNGLTQFYTSSMIISSAIPFYRPSWISLGLAYHQWFFRIFSISSKTNQDFPALRTIPHSSGPGCLCCGLPPSQSKTVTWLEPVISPGRGKHTSCA